MLRDNGKVTIAGYHQKILGIEVKFHSKTETYTFPTVPVLLHEQKVIERLKAFYEQGGPILKRPLIADTSEANSDIVEWDYTELTTKARLFLVSTKTSHGFFSGQKNLYSIVAEADLTRRMKRLPAVPTNHKIECDRNNNRVRLIGKNAGRRGVGEWVPI